MSKMLRNSIGSYVPMRAKGVLGVVRYNVCGPFEVPSLAENKYYVSFL